MIGRRGEEFGVARLPVRGCGQRQVFLAFEVVEETSLCETGISANVLDPRGRVALGTDDP
jgi:hypothetical protein